MATYAQLKKQIEQLAKQAEAALRAEKDVVLAKVRDAVSSFSLSVEEVFGGSAKKNVKNAKPTGAKRVPKGAGQAKYADPKTGATWSGFGRAPAWIASAKDRTKFLVDQQPAATAPTQSITVKPAAKAKVMPKAKKAPVAKKTAKAPQGAAPAKKTSRAAATATPAKKVAKDAPKAKAVLQAKKAINSAPKKAVVKANAPAKKEVPSKSDAQLPQAPAAQA